MCMPSPAYETEIRIRLMSGRETVANEIMLVCEIYMPTCSKNTRVESCFERSAEYQREFIEAQQRKELRKTYIDLTHI